VLFWRGEQRQVGRRVAGTAQQLEGGADSAFGMAGAGRSGRVVYTVSSTRWWQLKRFVSRRPSCDGLRERFRSRISPEMVSPDSRVARIGSSQGGLAQRKGGVPGTNSRSLEWHLSIPEMARLHSAGVHALCSSFPGAFRQDHSCCQSHRVMSSKGGSAGFAVAQCLSLPVSLVCAVGDSLENDARHACTTLNSNNWRSGPLSAEVGSSQTEGAASLPRPTFRISRSGPSFLLAFNCCWVSKEDPVNTNLDRVTANSIRWG
jgi:hypothetical protein